jgi:hypothetical protein
MVVATLSLQLLGVLALCGVTAGLASLGSVRRSALWLRGTPLPRALVYLSVASTAALLAVAAGGVPTPFTPESLGTPTLVLLVAGPPLVAFWLSGHLELFAAADVLVEFWRENDPGSAAERLSVGRYLVRTHHDWASTAAFLFGLLGLLVGVALSLSPESGVRLSGFVYATVGLHGLVLAGLTADYPYYRLDRGPEAREIDRLVAVRDRRHSS